MCLRLVLVSACLQAAQSADCSAFCLLQFCFSSEAEGEAEAEGCPVPLVRSLYTLLYCTRTAHSTLCARQCAVLSRARTIAFDLWPFTNICQTRVNIASDYRPPRRQSTCASARCCRLAFLRRDARLCRCRCVKSLLLRATHVRTSTRSSAVVSALFAPRRAALTSRSSGAAAAAAEVGAAAAAAAAAAGARRLA